VHTVCSAYAGAVKLTRKIYAYYAAFYVLQVVGSDDDDDILAIAVDNESIVVVGGTHGSVKPFINQVCNPHITGLYFTYITHVHWRVHWNDDSVQ
jgi:hypothetical protein